MPEQNQSVLTLNQYGAQYWLGDADQVSFEPDKIHTFLLEANQPLWIVSSEGRLGISRGGELVSGDAGNP